MNNEELWKANSISIAVMSNQIKNIEKNIQEIKNSFQDLLEKLDNQYASSEKVHNLELRIRNLEATNTWLIRTIGGIIITVLVGSIIAINQM